MNAPFSKTYQSILTVLTSKQLKMMFFAIFLSRQVLLKIRKMA